MHLNAFIHWVINVTGRTALHQRVLAQALSNWEGKNHKLSMLEMLFICRAEVKRGILICSPGSIEIYGSMNSCLPRLFYIRALSALSVSETCKNVLLSSVISFRNVAGSELAVLWKEVPWLTPTKTTMSCEIKRQSSTIRPQIGFGLDGLGGQCRLRSLLKRAWCMTCLKTSIHDFHAPSGCWQAKQLNSQALRK